MMVKRATGSCLDGCIPWWSSVSAAGARQESLSKLQVRVSQLSGEPLCSLLVDSSCTIEAIKYEIQLETQIPCHRQSIVHGKDVIPLAGDRCLRDLADGKTVILALIQAHKPALKESEFQLKDPTVLRNAIRSGACDKSLELLTLRNLPGLNETDHDGSSLLHLAAWGGLTDVCQALLDRSDFTMADSLDLYGLTALHCAAMRGHLDVARVLLTSSTFTNRDSSSAQFNPHDAGGWSARQLAELNNNTLIVQAIDAYPSGRKPTSVL